MNQENMIHAVDLCLLNHTCMNFIIHCIIFNNRGVNFTDLKTQSVYIVKLKP